MFEKLIFKFFYNYQHYKKYFCKILGSSLSLTTLFNPPILNLILEYIILKNNYKYQHPKKYFGKFLG